MLNKNLVIILPIKLKAFMQSDEYLGEQLIIDFMNKFDKFYNT